ncbi:MAG: YgfZ/GcvT domain-containing protein [Mycobacteriales bacterium]
MSLISVPATSSASATVFGQGRDAAVPAHYGDLFGEQRALAERVGLVDRSHRDILTVTGQDRLSWLHTLTTQHVSELAEHTGIDALILTPQGRIAHHMLLSEIGGTTFLDTEPGAGDVLLEFLQKMRFLLRVEPADASEQWAILSLLGPDAVRLLTRAGLVAQEFQLAHEPQLTQPPRSPGTAWPLVNLPGGGWLRVVPWPTQHSCDLLVPRDQLALVRDQLWSAGAARCGHEAYEALRVAAGRPRLGCETDDRAMPHELAWVASAVRLNKGCYPGQETVAKLHNLGQPPRRLVLLHLDGSSDQLPPRGEPVRWDGREVGVVGTAARHYELGGVALAVIKRNVSDDAALSVASMCAAIDTELSARNPLDGQASLDEVEAGAGKRRVAEFLAARRQARAG